MREINKILFITLSNIGDCILTLPALDLLMQEFPNAKITVLVSPRPAEIFQNNPKVNNTVVYDKHSLVKDKLRLFWHLKQENFALVVDLRNTAFGRLLPVKHRVFSNTGDILHMRQKHLSGLVKFLGKDVDWEAVRKQGLYINDEDRRYVDMLLNDFGITKDERIIAVSPGARSHIKRWAEKRFREVCDRLIEELAVKIVLLGDKGDSDIIQRIVKEARNKLVDLSAKTTILQLAALLERVSLLITNDSAILHLGSYLNIPILAIFGPTNESKYGPWSKISAAIKKDIVCRPCEKAQCRLSTLECMNLIKVDEVINIAKRLLASPCHLASTGHKTDFRRILIARTDRIGDVLLSTPVIKALRDTYPCAYIAMIVSPYAKEIVEGNPYLDEVLIYDKDKLHKGWLNSRRFALELKKKRFDLALILHPTNRMHLVTFFAGICRRVGYTKKLSFLLTDRIKHTKQLAEKHEMEYALDLVRYLGIEPKDKNLFMPLKKESEQWADNLLKEHGINDNNRLMVIHPTASCPSKIWPAERFAEVANQLILNYKAKIAVISGENDSAVVKSTIQNIHSLVIDLSGKITLSQLASLLKRAHLLISNDSGPVHIASSLGTPVISIFGRKQKGLSPQRWGPIGLKDRFLHKDVGCIECLAHNCVKEFACLKAITVEEVLRVVDEIFRT